MQINGKHSWRSFVVDKWTWMERHVGIFVLSLGTIAFLSAFVGIACNHWKSLPTFEQGHFASSLFNWITACLYEATQVLVLNMSAYIEQFNIWIGIARLFAVAFFTFIAIQAIRKLFSQTFSDFWIWCHRKNMVFVAGLGRLGLQIALNASQEGRLVVVQEPKEDNPNRSIAAEAGVVTVTEDGSDIDALREHVQRSPRTMYLVTGDDLTNINALANVLALRQEHARAHNKHLGPCECYVHIEHSQLHRSFSRCLLENSQDTDPGFKVHAFNIYHETACQLIIDELTPLRPRHKDEVALYVVFGFEQMGMAMVKELVEFAHFENLKRSRILVISEDAEQDYLKCTSTWPRISPRNVCVDLSQVRFDAAQDDWGNQSAGPEIDTGKTIDSKAVQYAANVQFCQLRSSHGFSLSEVGEFVRLATEPGVKPVFLFCHEDDTDNFRMASELEDSLQDNHGLNKKRSIDSKSAAVSQHPTVTDLPIFAFLPRSRPLQQVLQNGIQTNLAAVRPFGDVRQGLLRAHDTLVEEFAFEIAYDYHVNSKREETRDTLFKEQSVTTPALKRDDVSIPSDTECGVLSRDAFRTHLRKSPYWEQTSNLCAAEHKQVLVQLMGYKIARNSKQPASYHLNFAGLSDQQKETMARVEHNRWMAERLLIGWCYGPRSDYPPQRLSFCAEKHLDPADWQKDINQIARTLQILEERKIPFEKI
jgi:hypothetical protein